MREMGELADAAEANSTERDRLLAAMRPVRVATVDDMSDAGRALVSSLRARAERYRAAALREPATVDDLTT